MEFTTRVRLAIYQHFIDTGQAPNVDEAALRVGADREAVGRAFRDLFTGRMIVLEPDGSTIRMAAPFSGIPTRHTAEIGGRRYFANCAWDAFGIPAALHTDAVVRSECAQTQEPLELLVGSQRPTPSSWVFHTLVPVAQWWRDIVFT
jgi:hypothetical protein